MRIPYRFSSWGFLATALLSLAGCASSTGSPGIMIGSMLVAGCRR
jgi:hypothetical protein